MIVEPDFLDHWKTTLLVNLLKEETAPLYVLRLWAHCQLRKQWVFEGLASEALKALCRFPGHANSLESSLATSGFIRREEDGTLIVCKWDEYNAGLIANWENGKKGGRPPKRPPPRPPPNPKETHGLPMANPSQTDRCDAINKNQKNKNAREDREDGSGFDLFEGAKLCRFDTPECRDALLLWREHIWAKKHELLSAVNFTAIALQQSQAGWTPKQLVDAITASIAGGWNNIREPDRREAPARPQAKHSNGESLMDRVSKALNLDD